MSAPKRVEPQREEPWPMEGGRAGPWDHPAAPSAHRRAGEGPAFEARAPRDLMAGGASRPLDDDFGHRPDAGGRRVPHAGEEARARRVVPRFGPFTGPAEEIAPFAPEPFPPEPPAYGAPAQAEAPSRPRPAADWRGHDPFDAGEGARRPAPPEPLRHGPPEQYLPPHLRSEPRITGQPPGAAPVLTRADVHRLQAALYELTECRRLMGDAGGRSALPGTQEAPDSGEAGTL